MKRIFIIIMLIIGINQVNAQWYQVNTNTTENLYDIFFVDSLEGYCVGGTDNWGTPQSTGIILKTTDGGENWNAVFSKDSLTINSIAVVDVSGNKKLYAFGLKNGASHLVSTVVNTPFQNWSITPINYRPKQVKVYNNELYFVDKVDLILKKLTNGIVQNITNQIVSIFDINTDGLLFVNDLADRIFFSTDIGITIDTLSIHPVEFGQNNLTGAQVFLSDNYYLIYGTYPEATLTSFDNGITWQHNLLNFILAFAIDESHIIGFNNNNILQSDYNQSYKDTLAKVSIIPSKMYFRYNLGFIIGQNGIIYKSSNSFPVSTNESELKRKINISPNPAKDILRVEVSDDLQIDTIELYDIGGKKVKTFSKNKLTLNVEGLNSGTYFLKLSIKEDVITKKVIIE